MRIRFDFRPILYLVVGLVLLGVGTHFIHAFQVRRNADALLTRATHEEEAKHYPRAISYLRRYILIRPNDVDARCRYALLFADQARSVDDLQRALVALEDVLRRDPARRDVRRRTAELAMLPRLRRFAEAKEHVSALLQDAPADADLLALRGQCLEGEDRYREALKDYENATRIAPKTLDHYVREAVLLRRHLARPADADKVMGRMATLNSTSATAQLVLAQYYQEFDRTPAGRAKATKAVALARDLAPRDAEVILAVASLAMDGDAPAKDREQARSLLVQGTKDYPKDVRMVMSLAKLEVRGNNRKAAEAALERGLEAVPAQVDLLWELAELRLGGGKESEQRELLGRLREAGVTPALTNYMEARMLMAGGEWRKAADLFERTRPELDRRADVQKGCDLFLGRCYERLGDPDRQYAAYRRVVSSDPLSVGGCIGMGAALEALAKPAEAIAAYQRVKDVPEAFEARLRLARLLVGLNRNRPAAEQDWDRVEALLRKVGTSPEAVVDGILLRAEMLLGRGNPERALELLGTECGQMHDEPRLWAAQATLLEQTGHPEKVLPLLDRAEREAGDRVELRLARAAYWVRRGAAKALPELTRIAEKKSQYSAPEQAKLLGGLARAHAALDDKPGAVRRWKELAALQPANLDVRLILFDLAVADGKGEEVERAVNDIRTIEGDEGTLWRYARAAQLIRLATKGDKTGLPEAKALLGEVAAKRPGWGRVPLAEASLQEVEGNKDLAIIRYRSAMELGEKGPSTVRRLVELLYDRRSYAEADSVLRSLPEADRGQMGRLGAEVSLQVRDHERAITLARKAVAADSKDYRDHLWLGQILGTSEDRYEEAEKSLLRAVELGGDSPDTWVALTQHLVREGKRREAEESLETAKKKLTGKRAGPALAQCYEALGRLDEARGLYRQALADSRGDLATLSNVAKFYLRVGDMKEARGVLEEIIRAGVSSEEATWARRSLVFVLGTQGEYQSKRKALATLGLLSNAMDAATIRESPPDLLRDRALVLAREWDRKERQEGIRLLEALAARQPLAADDQFLLAQIYESVGKWREAGKLMLGLLAAEGGNATYAAAYVEALLRHDDADAAGPWIARLKKLQPRAFRTAALEARVLAATRRRDEAVALIRSHLLIHEADLLPSAVLLDRIGAVAPAEEFMRRYAGQAKRPEPSLLLAGFLGKHDKTKEALALCEKASAGSPAMAALTAAQALYASGDPKPYFTAVGQWLDKAEAGGRTDLSAVRAILLSLEGKHYESAALYRSMLARNPENAVAMNNLAFLMAFHEGKAGEAMGLLDKALALAGPSATLLDTRAAVRWKLGDPARAARELEEVADLAPSAVVYFHLAQALQAGKDLKAAKSAFRKAQELGLRPADLHPLERAVFRELLSSLGSR